jgi:hypothetical protein
LKDRAGLKSCEHIRLALSQKLSQDSRADVTRPTVTVASIVLFVLGSALVSNGPSAPTEIELELSNSAIHRYTGLFAAAGETLNWGADLGLDALVGANSERRPRDLLARLGRLWFVNLPIASLTHVASHDYGHFARADEAGFHTRALRVTHWPWPIPLTGSVESAGPRPAPSVQLSELGGGEQAVYTLKQTLTDKIYSANTANYFDWLVLGYAALDYPMYAWSDLSPSSLTSFDAFFRTQPGDFRQYVLALAEIESGEIKIRTVREYANGIRRDAWLNLADYALWAGFARVGAYVVTGSRQTTNPAIRIGALRIVPGAHATLSSLGPEKGVDVRLLTSAYLSHLDVRAIALPSGRHLWGSGVTMRSRETSRFLPEARADIWQRPTEGPGFRFEAGARHELPAFGGRLDASFHVGYKSAGYLADAPERAGILLSLSGTLRY